MWGTDMVTSLFLCVGNHGFFFVFLFSPVGSICCSYAGHHTNCREYCQAIFRTDSSPGPSQIKAVENYCASISPQLIHCVNNYTQSYPMRNPTDSKYKNSFRNIFPLKMYVGCSESTACYLFQTAVFQNSRHH